MPRVLTKKYRLQARPARPTRPSIAGGRPATPVPPRKGMPPLSKCAQAILAHFQQLWGTYHDLPELALAAEWVVFCRPEAFQHFPQAMTQGGPPGFPGGPMPPCQVPPMGMSGPTPAQASARLHWVLPHPPFNHEISPQFRQPFVTAVIQALLGARCMSYQTPLAPPRGRYGLLINTDPSSAPVGVPVTLNQLNGGSASAQGEEAMPPETEIVEGATAAANGVGLDGLPIDAPIDGVPMNAAEVADRMVDAEVAAANANSVANAIANGEIIVETQEIIDDAANGVASEPEGAFAAYFGDITRHPVMMGSAFAIGWLLARR